MFYFKSPIGKTSEETAAILIEKWGKGYSKVRDSNYPRQGWNKFRLFE